MRVNPWTLSYIRTCHTFVGAHGLLPVHFVGSVFVAGLFIPSRMEGSLVKCPLFFGEVKTNNYCDSSATDCCTYSIIYKHNSDLWVKLLNCGYSRYVFVRALPLLVSRIEFCFCSRKFERNSPVLGTPNTSQTRPVQRSIDRSLDSSALLYSIYSSIFTHASFTNVACITFRFSIFAICKSL